MRTPLAMTTSRRAALAIGAPLAILIIGWGAVTEIAWAGQGSYPVSLSIPVHGRTATIAVDSGQLRVGPAAGDALQLTGTAHYALVRSRVTWTSTASGVSVRSQCEFPTGPCSFNFQVAVPAGRRAVVSDGSGDVTLSRLAGPVRVGDDSGDVHATALSGGVTIVDHSGDIFGSALSGPQVVVQNQSGNITISGLASPDVSVSDESGDVRLTFTKVPDKVRILDQSGNITVVLPRGNTAYNVTASTSSGQRSVNVPISSSSPHVITVTDQSGDITITR